jgi:hypothetical protein
MICKQSHFYREKELLLRFHTITGRNRIGSTNSSGLNSLPSFDCLHDHAATNILSSSSFSTTFVKEPIVPPSTRSTTSETLELDTKQTPISRHQSRFYPHGWKCRFCTAPATMRCISCDDDLYCLDCFDNVHYKSEKSTLAFFAHHKSILLTNESVLATPNSTHATATVIDNAHMQLPITQIAMQRQPTMSTPSHTPHSLLHPIPSMTSAKLYPSLDHVTGHK